MTSSEIEDMKALLRRMQAEDPGFRVFGADHHKYRLGPTLSESELQAFEQQHSITLPADFRFFMEEAGNGGAIRSSAPYISINAGAGPSCGVMPLEEAVIGCDLSKPFPLTEAVDVRAIPGIERWGDEEAFPGVLEICYHGCATFSYLVVSGPAYGTVWITDLDLKNFHCSHPSFESWYGAWMKRLKEHALPRLANERRIAGVEVGMTKAEVIALCGGEWKLKPYWGGKTFLSFEHLSTEFVLSEQEVVERIVTHSIQC